MTSIANFGLLKGIENYDANQKIKKTTFYCKCIKNELLTYIRLNKNKHIDTISFETSIGEDIVLSDVLADETDFENQALSKIDIRKILDVLTDKEKRLIEDRLAGKTQSEIARNMNLSSQRIFVMLQDIRFKVMKECLRDTRRLKMKNKLYKRKRKCRYYIADKEKFKNAMSHLIKDILIIVLITYIIFDFFNSIKTNEVKAAEPVEKITDYMVQSGDTYWSIAQEFDKSKDDIRIYVDRLENINGIKAGDLKAGEIIKVIEMEV